MFHGLGRLLLLRLGLLVGFLPFDFLSSQSRAQCPGFLQIKHAPFFMRESRSSVVMASTSMAFGSLSSLFCRFGIVLVEDEAVLKAYLPRMSSALR